MSNIVPLRNSNKVHELLDARISEVISRTAQEFVLSPCDIAGVFRAIEFKLFVKQYDDA